MLGVALSACGGDDPDDPKPDDPNKPDPNATALALNIVDSTDAIAPILDDISMPATFTATVSGFKNDADADKVSLKLSADGLNMSSHRSVQGGTAHFTVTVSHNGQTKLPCGEKTISVEPSSIPSGYKYVDGAKTTAISVKTGETKECRIQVNQRNIEAFNRYANTTNGLKRHYELIEDVKLPPKPVNESNWTPIGFRANSSTPYEFTGSFDGRGHAISDLQIHIPNEDHLGLFARISSGAQIENLGLINSSVKGSNQSPLGSLLGRNNGGTVRNCYATGSVSGSGQVGGLVGYNGPGTVEYSYAKVNVTATYSSSGGLVGLNEDTVQNSYATGDVIGTGAVGGLVGANNEGSTVQNCYATGNVSGSDSNIGGVVGDLYRGRVENCYATGSVRNSNTSRDNTGGVVGQNYSGSWLQNCVALNPRVTTAYSQSSSGLGRIVGYNNSGSIVNNYGRDNMHIYYATNALGNNGSPKNPVANNADSSDGEDVDASDYNVLSFWEDVLAEFNTHWEWNEASSLPILKGVGGAQNPTVQ